MKGEGKTRYLLGVDVGTTGTRTILVAETGKIVASASEGYPLLIPRVGWAEQKPEDWWRATQKGVAKVLADSSVKVSRIVGIGLSGQYHGAVLIGKRHEVLRPCILWCDQRTTEEGQYVIGKVGKERLMRIACTPGFPYFTACKLLWVRENEPEVYEKLYKILLPKDYIRLKLTGNFATDVTDASGTLFLDVRERRWSKEILECLNVDQDILPECFESADVTGRVTKEAAVRTGLRAGIPVVGGAGDQAAQAVGNGVIEEGLVAFTMGTSGVVFAPTDEIKTDSQGRVDSFCHAVPGKYHVMSVMNSAAGSLRWFEENFADSEREEARKKGVSVYEILAEKASKVPVGSEKLLFLPYLAGERHPHSDPHARGVFFGLHLNHTKGHVVRSILEGVAYGFRDCLEVIKKLGIPVREIRITGGGAKSELWREIQANVSGENMVITSTPDGAAYGGAILASVGTRIYGSVKEACDRLVQVKNRLMPNGHEVDKYTQFFKVYRALYPLLKRNFQDLAKL